MVFGCYGYWSFKNNIKKRLFLIEIIRSCYGNWNLKVIRLNYILFYLVFYINKFWLKY